MFPIGLVVSCTQSPEAIGSLKTSEGNLVRNHIFRDGSLGRTLICPANESHKVQILVNSKFENTFNFQFSGNISKIIESLVNEI